MARPRRDGPRRKFDWTGAAAQQASFNEGLANALVREVSNRTLLQGYGQPTLTRVRGCIGLRALVAQIDYQWAAGLIVADLKAIDLGVTAIPTPWSEPEAQWLWYACGFQHLRTGDPPVVDIVTIDAKAQRKLDGQEEGIVLVVEQNNAGGGTDAMDLMGSTIRLGWLLP